MTAMQAIKEKCLDCTCGQREEVKQCPITDCPLYGFRLGKNMNRKPREYTEEQKAELKERGRRMAEARKKKKENIATKE